jgi:hypothetical protein
MNLPQLEEQLHVEGFRHTYVWQDGPKRTTPTTPMPEKPRTSFSMAR